MGDIEEVRKFIDSLTPAELVALNYDWRTWARPNQLAPAWDWTIWLLMAGRGFGKTRTGSEWVIEQAKKFPESRGALVSMDAGSARDVMVEGESGILACSPPDFMPNYEPSKRRLTWPNGSVATIFTSVSPEDLRGPQHHWVWADELAAWSNVQLTWDMMMFGLRLGRNPQIIITTTPKPIPLVRRLVDEASANPMGRVALTRGTTYDNRANLATSFLQEIITQYEGTVLGRQELNAELIDPEESGIIKRSWFKLWAHDKPTPKFEYIVQSYDTAYTEKTENDPTACTAWGVFEEHGNPGVYSAMLLDAWSEHMAYPDLREKAKSEWQVKYGTKEKQADVALIEEKGSGISLIQDLRIARIPVTPYNPGNADKMQRLHAVSHLFSNGRVWLLESSKKPGQPVTWAEEMISQLCAFPLVEHDDYVDSTTQALRLLRDQHWLRVDLEEEITEYDYTQDRRKANPYAQ